MLMSYDLHANEYYMKCEATHTLDVSKSMALIHCEREIISMTFHRMSKFV